MTFPDPLTYGFPEWLDYDGELYLARDIVSIGEPPTLENLREAYSKGIFPWPHDGIPLPWFCPRRRAVLDFADLHVPKSLQRARARTELVFTIDKDFRQVMAECSKAHRPGQSGTWITPEFIDAYSELHNAGMAHSVEARTPESEPVGGVYGVDAGGVFCGESMFYRRPNASKLALLFLIDHLRSHGSTWLDCQVMTPHMKALGAKEISRVDFLNRLKMTQQKSRRIF